MRFKGKHDLLRELARWREEAESSPLITDYNARRLRRLTRVDRFLGLEGIALGTGVAAALGAPWLTWRMADAAVLLYLCLHVAAMVDAWSRFKRTWHGIVDPRNEDHTRVLPLTPAARLGPAVLLSVRNLADALILNLVPIGLYLVGTLVGTGDKFTFTIWMTVLAIDGLLFAGLASPIFLSESLYWRWGRGRGAGLMSVPLLLLFSLLLTVLPVGLGVSALGVLGLVIVSTPGGWGALAGAALLFLSAWAAPTVFRPYFRFLLLMAARNFSAVEKTIMEN